jgi:hypothetical protein
MTMGLEQVVANLVEQVEQRFYGKYRGFVVDNGDPENLGRLKLQVPSVLGPEVVTGWAMPCVPYGGNANQGMVLIPDVKAGVWVEFEAGNLEFPIWVGTFWSKPEGTSEMPLPNNPDGSETDALQSPPTRKMLKTSAGHTIQLEDGEGDLRILITDGQAESYIVFKEGELSLTYKKNSITLTDEDITIKDSNDNTLTQNSNGSLLSYQENTIALTDKGIVIKDANSNTLTQDSGGISIQDKNGNNITLDAFSGGIPKTPGITINGDQKVCLEGLITWLLSHTHLGNMGAPCPLNPTDMAQLQNKRILPNSDVVSQKVKLG